MVSQGLKSILGYEGGKNLRETGNVPVMEAHVTQAADSVERGVKEVQKATQYQKSARKKKCYLCTQTAA